jgi:hypothetical protein
MERADSGGGFSVLDGGALVMGSAISSILMLGVRRADLSESAWIMIGVTFTLVAVTAAGPFIFLARRFVRRLRHYPKTGDKLWALLGAPWLATALIQSAMPLTEPRHNPLLTTTLSVGLAVACLIALAVIWGTWVIVPPEQASKIEAAPWTNRVGLILSIAWPLQCGLGMIVLS